MAGRRMHLILPPGSAPGHELQKRSKESGIFQSLGIPLILFFFTKSRVKKGGHGKMLPLITLLTALHLYRDMLLIGK